MLKRCIKNLTVVFLLGACCNVATATHLSLRLANSVPYGSPKSLSLNSDVYHLSQKESVHDRFQNTLKPSGWHSVEWKLGRWVTSFNSLYSAMKLDTDKLSTLSIQLITQDNAFSSPESCQNIPLKESTAILIATDKCEVS
jgi:hypothetical protein